LLGGFVIDVLLSMAKKIIIKKIGAAMGNLGPGHKLASKPKPAAAEEEV